MLPLSLSIEKACEMSGIGRTKIYELLKNGKLRGCKIGKRTLILQVDLQNFLNSLEVYSAQEKGK